MVGFFFGVPQNSPPPPPPPPPKKNVFVPCAFPFKPTQSGPNPILILGCYPCGMVLKGNPSKTNLGVPPLFKTENETPTRTPPPEGRALLDSARAETGSRSSIRAVRRRPSSAVIVGGWFWTNDASKQGVQGVANQLVGFTAQRTLSTAHIRSSDHLTVTLEITRESFVCVPLSANQCNRLWHHLQ